MTPPAIRLFHRDSERHFIVAGTDVYAGRPRAQRITRSDRMSEPLDGVTREELLQAAAYFAQRYETPIDDTPNDYRAAGTIRSAGLLNLAEVKQLDSDPSGVPASRTALERHLDFFDSETFDGRIALGENWRSWRRLGYGYFRTLIGTLGSVMFFGRIRDWFAIDIARIKEKRPQRPTGLYDISGQVNERLLDEYLNEFNLRCSNGVISQDDAIELIQRKATPGSVSKRQFKSLFRLCTRLNRHRKVITKEQFRGLFDGSLLYLAASTPDAHGRRRLLLRTAGAPLIIKLAVLAMLVVFAPRIGDPGGVWRHVGGWLLVAASWLLYAILDARTAVERSVVLIVGVLAAASVWSSLSWNDALTVWPIIILTAVIAISQQWRPVLQYAFYLRFPLLLALTTMLLPMIAIWGAPLLFKSLFMLDWAGVMFVVLLAVLVAEVSLASARVIALYADRRFTVRPWPAPADLIERRGRWFALLIALPVIVGLVWLSEAPRLIAALAAGAGILLAFRVKRLAQWLGRKKTTLAAWSRRFVARKLNELPADTNGYVDRSGDVLPGHLANVAFFVTTLVLYAIGYFVLKPTSVVQAPAIAFVLFILIMLGWFLPAFSFFADKYRVSTVIALAVIPFVLYFINDIDHYYQMPVAARTTAPDTNGSTSRELRTAFDKRLGRVRAIYPDVEPVIIGVAAGGGGGSAALWSARVLAGLQHQFGARFTDSIQMISAVSGGSVGTMYFLSAFDRPVDGHGGAPSEPRLNDTVHLAGSSTLSSVAWGLSYPDFWRFFSLRHWNPYVDRGWALEEALDAKLPERGVQLSQWRDGMLAGWRPAGLFNATVSETGDRLVISPLRLRRVNKEACREPDTSRAADCEDQIDADTLSGLHASNRDLRVATAARLSATFPFVLPIPKPLRTAGEESGYHLADGGYYDNDGLLTLVEWTQKAMAFAEPSTAQKTKILLVDIRVVDPKPGPRSRAGWIYATLGPVLTMLSARGTSQVSRNLVDVKLLSDLGHTGNFQIQHVAFPLTLTTSRSWHLPDSEREEIERYWDTDPDVLRSRRELCAFLGPSEWKCEGSSTTRFP